MGRDEQFVNRARSAHDAGAVDATWLDFSGEPDRGLVSYYGEVSREKLEVLAARTAQAVWLVVDGDSESQDDDAVLAIAALAAALDAAGIKWTSGRG